MNLLHDAILGCFFSPAAAVFPDLGITMEHGGTCEGPNLIKYQDIALALYRQLTPTFFFHAQPAKIESVKHVLSFAVPHS